MKPTDIAFFATTQLALLDRELQAELDETASLATQSSPTTLQRAGLAILNLHVVSQRTGLGGRSVLDLQLDPAIGHTELPEHGIRVGDIVGLKESIGGAAKKKEKNEVESKSLDGVVVKVSTSSVNVALEKEDADVPGGKLWIIKLANDVTYKRMNQTMSKLEKLNSSETSPFIRVLFGQSSPTPVPVDPGQLDEKVGSIQWITDGLNDSQIDAIKFAIASPEIALIHGPPGTGKTHTLIEFILQLLTRNKANPAFRILVCGPSNISVDNIVERLAPHKIPMVRLGHPARLLPSVLNHSLDVLTKTSDAAALVQDIRNEMDAKQASIRKTRTGRERRVIYGELKDLRKEFRERERGCVEELVRTSKVVLATLHGAGGYQLKNADFDIVIIDEASQALEAQCWVPLLRARKAVLAGDHLQLPPTIKSLNSKSTPKPDDKKDKPATSNGETKDSDSIPKNATLETTLFDRLLSLHGPSIKRMLTTQYRMHETIMTYPSSSLYENKLIASDSVKHRLLKDLPYAVLDTDDTREPLIFYDTQGGAFPEKAEEDDFTSASNSNSSNNKPKPKRTLLAESKSNEMEASLVALHVHRLTSAGLKPSDIAVITPYNAQLSLLSSLLKERHPGIELGSVDGFQGREKEAVVLSLVRSNTTGEVGFLGERRRLNVAMTRPRRQLCVVGDSETVGKGGGFLKGWMAFLEEQADLRYPDPSDLADVGG
ncbi:MAG: hypothetical protein M1828_003574 [Chrysothrix sp. TS-e1954]|nr:MAG: hypothetical protein M1828_003574 [Chrysothrix sp. TS-e1954]